MRLTHHSEAPRWTEAADDIGLGDYSAWGDAERIAVNVNTLYREFSGDPTPPAFADLFGTMAGLAKRETVKPQM